MEDMTAAYIGLAIIIFAAANGGYFEHCFYTLVYNCRLAVGR